jgi:hypothetical protein
MSGEGDQAATWKDKHENFVRSFSLVEYDSEDEQEYDVLSPIPETPADQIDGELTLSQGKQTTLAMWDIYLTLTVNSQLV